MMRRSARAIAHKARLLVVAACAIAALALPVTARASEGIDPRASEALRYPLVMQVDTNSGRSSQTRSIPNNSSFSYQNGTALSGRTLYVQLYTTSGAAYTYPQSFTGTNEQKILTSTRNGTLNITPHLWLSSGSLYLRGTWITVVNYGA